MHSRKRFVICVTAALLSVCGVASSSCWAEGRWSSSWPQWRGPTRDAQITAPAWPNSLADRSLERSWSVPLGPSYSGPIVFGDLVFVTETQGRREEVVPLLTWSDRRDQDFPEQPLPYSPRLLVMELGGGF